MGNLMLWYNDGKLVLTANKAVPVTQKTQKLLTE